jgi:hypothetical protein
MPVQINEVIVRTVVDPAPGKGRGGEKQDMPASTTNAQEIDLLEKVLEIIKDKNER